MITYALRRLHTNPSDWIKTKHLQFASALFLVREKCKFFIWCERRDLMGSAHRLLRKPRLCSPSARGFKSLPVFRHKNKEPTLKCKFFIWCERRDLNPYGITTRPSNVRVCRFRHSRKCLYNIPLKVLFVNTFFQDFYNFHNFFAIVNAYFYKKPMQTP